MSGGFSDFAAGALVDHFQSHLSMAEAALPS
jgi:hypothetical protein